jgi:transposase
MNQALFDSVEKFAACVRGLCTHRWHGLQSVTRFAKEAVKLVLAQGLTLEEAALWPAILKGTLGNWVSAAKRGSTPKAAPGSRTVPELEAEVAKLRRELAEARMERDIVKKAAAYFARESLPSTRS